MQDCRKQGAGFLLIIATMKEIPLTQGKVAIVDDCDYDLVSKNRWFYNSSGKGYAGRQLPRNNGKQREQKMHRLILGVADQDIHVDHINGNGLDNRRANLRLCSASQNRINSGLDRNNTSGIKGVYLHKETGKFCAVIGFNGKHKYLGLFPTKEQAAHARAMAEVELYGEFSRHNKTPNTLKGKNEQ